MSDNKNRLDLNAQLDSLMEDVRAASEEVKKRREADRAQDARDAKQSKSKTLSAIIIAVATVALVLIAYFVVFGGESGQYNPPDEANLTRSQSMGKNAVERPNCVTPNAPTAPPQAPSMRGQAQQRIVRPSDGYEQPGDDPRGM